MQDENAGRYSQANKAERAVSKSSAFYDNSTWDLVDATRQDPKAVGNTDAEYLPAEMKTMTPTQREAYIKEKSAERTRIQGEIQKLSEKRKQYTAEHTSAADQAGSLDAALIKAVKAQAKAKKMDF